MAQTVPRRTSHPDGCDHEPQAQGPDSVTTNERRRMMIVCLFSPLVSPTVYAHLYVGCHAHGEEIR